ncbi:MAG: YdcF family protein [Ilumatobacteraceae bacterium]
MTETAATVSRLRRGRLWLRVGLLLAVAGVGYLAVTLYQVWSTGRAYEARPVDAIVVLGAAQYDGRPSPQLAARLDEVVRLWPQDLAPVVVVTGGSQPGDRFTEAAASADYLVERGVPESAILFEDEGASTYESLRSTVRVLDVGDDRVSVLLVTDPFHSLRSRLIAEEVGLEAYVAPTSTSVIGGWRDVALHVKEASGVAVGRLTGFERLSGLVG